MRRLSGVGDGLTAAKALFVLIVVPTAVFSQEYLEDRFTVPKFEDGFEDKPRVRLYNNDLDYDTDTVTKFSRDAVEAAPDTIKTPTFAPPQSLPYLRFEKNVGPFSRQFVESGSLKYYGGASPAQYPASTYSLDNVEMTRSDDNMMESLQRYSLHPDPKPLTNNIEIPKEIGADGFTYYGAAEIFNARPYMLARPIAARSMSVDASAKPVGEAKHPLRAAVEKRVYSDAVTTYSGTYSRPFQKSLAEFRSEYESTHGVTFNPVRSNPNHKTGKHYYSIEEKSAQLTRSSKEFKIVCYYEAWSVYRKAPFDFGVNDIDPFSCTHVIYSFAGLDKDTLTIISLDKEEDLIKGSYKAAVGLKAKNPSLKVMIAIGGWNEGGKKYSNMAATKQSRARFIESVVDMLQQHNFDGLDLDWEYPGATDRDGKWADKKNFADLVDELSIAFKPHGWLLSAAVSPAKFRVEEGYDVARISEKLDFINVMTYDLHGDWDGFADHHAPLHTRDHDSWEFQSLNTEKGLALWKARGAPLEKLMLGTPFYGRSFTLRDESKNTPGSASSGPGLGGEYTEEPGYLGYLEICQMVQQGGWNTHMDSDMNTYIVKGDQWVGYDTVDNIKRKMHFVRKAGLGGAMIWAIDLDDYKGKCGPKAPLLTNMNLILRPKGGIVEETDIEVIADLQLGGGNNYDYDYESSDSGAWNGDNGVDNGGWNGDNDVTDSDNNDDNDDGFVCPGEGQFPSQDKCDVFYTCTSDGKAHRFECADGLLYDRVSGNCNWPETVTCASLISPTLYKDRICHTLDDGVYTDPLQSDQFFHCRSGKRTKMSCPLGLHFDSFTAMCTNAHFVRFVPGYIIRAAASPIMSHTSEALTMTYKQQTNPKVLCYFSNWSGMRDGDGKYVPENIPANKCTHVVYAFAKLNEKEMSPAPSGPLADINEDFYSRVIKTVKADNPDIKVLIAVGGWADSAGDKYSSLVNSQENRAKFVRNTQKFLDIHGFEGVVLEWHFPVCWQSDCSRGPTSDQGGFSKLMSQLKKSLGDDYVVGATLSGYTSVIDRAYDVAALSGSVDFLNVMSYDMHGFWDGETNHHAPLTSASGPSVESTMNMYVSKGADRSKLILGIPFYGQSYTTRGAPGGMGHPTTGPGNAGKWTKQPGMLGYAEICVNIKTEGWNVVGSSVGTYATDRESKQWVGYDSMTDVEKKARYAKTSGFGGVAISTLDLDDFGNLCCEGVYPLLTTVASVILGQSPPVRGCGRPTAPVTPAPKPPSQTDRWDDGSKDKKEWEKWTPAATQPSTTAWTTKRTTTTTKSTTTSDWNSGDYDYNGGNDWDNGQWDGDNNGGWNGDDGTWKPSTESSNDNEEAPECIEGEYLRSPENCQQYYRCFNGKKVLHSCAGGLAWHHLTQHCDWADNVKCHRRSIFDHHDQAIVVGDYEDDDDVFAVGFADTEMPDENVGKSCSGNDYSSVPGDCTSFYQCANGAQLKQSCSQGLHFNAAEKLCDWPDRAGCSGKVYGAEACDGSSYKPNPADCGSYLVCVHGEFVKFECQAGTHWDTKIQSCNHAELAGCSSDISSNNDNDNSVVETVGEQETDNQWSNNGDYNSGDYNSGDYNSGDWDNGQWGGDNGQWRPSTKPTTSPRPTGPTEPIPLQGPLSGDYKVVCYFTNWAWYRPGIGKYKPSDIDPNICTHIVYGFAVLDYSTLLMKPHDSWADIDNDFYGKVTEFKKYGIKVTVAIGGWNDSQGNKYSRLVNNPAARKKFIENVMAFIHKYNFDGLDLDWEYPSCWQTECKEERYSDKDAFAAWVRELKEAFRPRGYLLSAAVSPSKKIIDVGYDVPSIARDLDWIAVMTYDYHGHWDKRTGHVAPFYEHPDDEFFYFNTNYTINYWIKSGAPRTKLVMGMPLYGQAFTLDSVEEHGLNAPARQKGKAGQFTRAAGFLAYYEICKDIKNGGWTVVKDAEGRMGPYAYKGRQWVGYDDVETIRRKSEFVREMGLGGGMVWALDLDDFKNTCGEGAHPLMNTIKEVLGPAKGQYAATKDAENGDTLEEQINEPEPEPESEPQPQGEPKSETEPESDMIEDGESEHEMEDVEEINEKSVSDQYKVVCYFTNWAWYRPGRGKYKPDDIDASLCTHIVYGFAVLDNNKLVLRAHDSWADFDNEFYKKVTALKSKNKKVLLALGGWNDSAGKKYSTLVNNPTARKKFVQHAVAFLKKHNFDGLDLDWEYPKCWQVDCSKGPSSDKAGFTAWVKELATAFKPHGFLVTAAVSPSNKVMDEAYDIPALNKYLDYISVMTYDYHGQWDKQTGHVAPMFAHSKDFNEFFNVNYTVNYWLQGGLAPSKLIMGMPMYGQSFTLASAAKNGLNSKTYGGGTAGSFTRARGFLSFYEICDNVQNKGWKVIKDPSGTMGPYAYKGNQWVSYDDAAMIKFKSEYVKKMRLGGAMIWALDLDDFRNHCGCGENPLLNTINSVLRSTKYNHICPTVGNFRIGDLEVSPSPYKDCSAGNFAAVQGDCSSYKICNNGEYETQTCPPGLHWNRDRCDWPENSVCGGDSAPGQDNTETDNDESNENDIVIIPEEIPDKEEEETEVEAATVVDTGKKVVCYFTNWAWYRQGKGKYTPDHIDADLCTHINYGFAVLHPNKLIMTPHDSWADIDNKFFERVAAFKKKGIKVSIALGGWNDSEGNKYSRMVNDPAARARFITEAVNFIEKYGFEGLDLDWEYPKCWQVDCDKGPESDKASFAALVKELSAELKPRGWLLSAAVSPSKKVIDAGYDVPVLSEYLDIINVMTYDYHGHWDKKTGHVAPMYEHPEDEFYYFNANYTMNYWVQLGASKDKLVMGMPMYGQSFSLGERSNNGLNAPAYGRGQAGEFTRAGGFLAYYEICERVQGQGWNIIKDEKDRMGPYAYKGDQWVGYDDIAMIRLKSQWVMDNNFGGGMIWALDLDDFTNTCGCEKYPLLRTINRVLRGYSVADPGCDNMLRAKPYSIPLLPNKDDPYQQDYDLLPDSLIK